MENYSKITKPEFEVELEEKAETHRDAVPNFFNSELDQLLNHNVLVSVLFPVVGHTGANLCLV